MNFVYIQGKFKAKILKENMDSFEVRLLEGICGECKKCRGVLTFRKEYASSHRNIF